MKGFIFKEDTMTDILLRLVLTFLAVGGIVSGYLVTMDEISKWEPDPAMTTQEYSATVKEGRNHD